MQISSLKQLFDDSYLSQSQFSFLRKVYSRESISLFYEIRTLLYLGVLLFTTGAGILIYKNTDTLGHSVNIALLTALMLACFWYCARHREPFTPEEVSSPTPYYEYALLLAALLFVSIEGYLQNIYGIFGQQWGLAALIPAVLFFILAYLFDHRGVLSLAITATASAVGLEVSASNWFRSNVFTHEALIWPAVSLGVACITAGLLLNRAALKRHFTFSYLIWGATLLFSGLLAALIEFKPTFLYALILVATSGGAIAYATRTQTFVFFLYGVLFAYVGVTTLLALAIGFGGGFGFWYFYFLASCTGMVYFIVHSLKTYRGR